MIFIVSYSACDNGSIVLAFLFLDFHEGMVVVGEAFIFFLDSLEGLFLPSCCLHLGQQGKPRSAVI